MGWTPDSMIIARKIVTLKEIRRYQDSDIVASALSLRKDRKLSLMGMLNACVYCVAKKWNAIKERVDESGKREWEVDKQKIQEIASASTDGLINISFSVQWMSEYLKKFWPGACHNPKSIRVTRRFMRDELKLFEFEDLDYSEDKIKENRTCIPREVERVDFMAMLLLYEALEKSYLDRIEYDHRHDETLPELTSFLPKHKAGLVVQVFNSLFGRIARFGRKDNPESAPGDAIHPLPEVVSVPIRTMPTPPHNSFFPVLVPVAEGTSKVKKHCFPKWRNFVEKCIRKFIGNEPDWDWLAIA